MNAEHESAATLDEIEGHLHLGLFEHAWEMLDLLPPDQQRDPRAVRVLMFCAFRCGAYQATEKLALHLARSSGGPRLSAGTVLHELAKIRWRDGDPSGARRLVVAAVEADPEQRRRILADRALPSSLLP
jgi:hypothetical protein